MRTLVCGGRNYSDRRRVYETLDKIGVTILISGGAAGADRIAEDWAEYRQIPKQIFRADWEKHGRAAGPIRNQKMLDEGKPKLVIAFPGGRGTADMTRRARAAGIKVLTM